MPERKDVERLLSTADKDIVEIGADGQIYETGLAPLPGPGKKIAGITDARGEYTGDRCN